MHPAPAITWALPDVSGSPELRKNVPPMSRPWSRAARQSRTAHEAVVFTQAGVPRARHASSQRATFTASGRPTCSGHGTGWPLARLTSATARMKAACFQSKSNDTGVWENHRSNG